jgi:hypothetical protein
MYCQCAPDAPLDFFLSTYNVVSWTAHAQIRPWVIVISKCATPKCHATNALSLSINTIIIYVQRRVHLNPLWATATFRKTREKHAIQIELFTELKPHWIPYVFFYPKVPYTMRKCLKFHGIYRNSVHEPIMNSAVSPGIPSFLVERNTARVLL